MLEKFYIIRHGETDWNALGLLNGVTDRPLNEKGINQAKINLLRTNQKVIKNKKINLK